MFSQFTKTPTVHAEPGTKQSVYGSHYSNENNRFMMNQQAMEAPTPCILMTGVCSDNALKLYHFFKNFGIIQHYGSEPQEESMLIQYKSEESLRRALNSWEKERANFADVILSIIQEDQKNMMNHKANDYSSLNYQRNQMNHSSTRVPTFVDKKSLKEKFIDVFLNI